MLNKTLEQHHAPQCPAHLYTLGQVLTVARTSPEPAHSLIDRSVTITGDLWSEGDVQVDGHICGNVNCAQLIVGRDAAITGAIMAEEVVVRGRVMGTIRAIRVRLQSTARVESEIIYKVLSIDEGAKFEGAARSRPNPLQAEAAVSPMTELRQMMAKAEAGRANGAADGSKNQAKTSGADAGHTIVPRKRRGSKRKPGRLPEATGAVMFRQPET